MSAPAGRLVAAAVVAAAGVVGLTYLGGALGFGRDVHATRAAAAGAVLFVGTAVALWRRAPVAVRGLALAAGLGGAAAAWWWVPAGSGGPSLAAAVADRDEAGGRLDRLTPGGAAGADVPELVALLARADAVAKTYPDLVGRLRDGLTQRTSSAAAEIVEQFRGAPPGDLAAYRAAEARAVLLKGAYPDRRPDLDAAARGWVERSVAARATVLRGLGALDWDGFDRTAADRHALADAFPASRAVLAHVEDEAVGGWVGVEVARLTGERVVQGDVAPTPREAREGCGAVRDRLLALRSVDATPGRFRAARGVLFRAAHDAAREECREHLAAGRYAAAFGVARAHAVEWFATAEVLGPDAQLHLARLRDGYRYLAVLSAKAGAAPDPAPPPRTRP